MLSEYIEGPKSLMFGGEVSTNLETARRLNPYNLKLYYEGTRTVVDEVVTITAPTEPVSSTDMKNYLKIETSETSDDTLIGYLIKAARRQCEKYTRRAIVRQCWYLTMDKVPLDGRLILPYPPLISVTSIVTFGTDDVSDTFTNTYYSVDTTSIPGRILLDYAQAWPTDLRDYSAFRVEFISGLADATGVEDEIKLCIMRLVGMWYEHREEVESGDSFKMPEGIKAILDPFRIVCL